MTPTFPHLPADQLKSYMTDEERQNILEKTNLECVYVQESAAASDVGDFDTAYGWLRLIELDVPSLGFMKRTEGADFIRKNGFITTKADKLLGPDWLDK